MHSMRHYFGLVLLTMLAGFLPSYGNAQLSPRSPAAQPDPTERRTVPPPPEQKQLDELEPTVTIKKIDDQQVEEFRIRGKLYMMRVTPKAGGKPYYLIDKDGSGHFEPGEAYSQQISVPKWVVLEF
ncbi:MAG: DUF2782 domain-containing protein [Burkholderiaceae bacterium]|jgi:hypothetical protein